MPLKLERQAMPAQDARKRRKNFNEVALGYTEELALAEAKRCLGCKNSQCRQGCPVDIDIKAFIEAIRKKDYTGALRIIKEKNNLPAICGRVCPQETQCEEYCILSKKDKPVAIGRLERFVADWVIDKKIREEMPQAVIKKNKKVAVIGSGPAGLTCAADLSKLGYAVTVFEGLHASGGVLRYGIPEFRLPKHILDIEVEFIQKLGVNIALNIVVGKTKTMEDLRQEGFEAFFVGTGAGLPYFLEIPGENLNGVYSANEFLTRVNLMKAYKFPEYDTPVVIGNKVCVIGAGNVAMDSARAALRLGAEEVTIVYRRSVKEMPARIEEIEHAKEEGIKFHLLTVPLRILGDKFGRVKALICIKNELGEPDASGRRRPVPIAGSEFELLSETVICAIGQGPNPLLLSTLPDLKLNKRGNVVADDNLMTSIPGVFAGGDIVTGAATVIEAMGAGKHAAENIDSYLKNKQFP
ncbi:MAG: NADPH-dependent glutamate synthase [Candidatus Omnitrophota bacterium]